jgi:cytolysin-activating lysine-acyltransferase
VNALNDVASPVARPNSRAKTTSETPTPQSGTSADAQMGLTEKLRRDAATLRNTVVFSQAVGVLMRSPHYREYRIADLEWLLLPPITNGQFRIGETKLDEKHGGATLPVALVLWAFVSPEVDQRLTMAMGTAPQLAPGEWKSGDIPWLLHAAGETRFVRPVVNQLMQTTFKGQKVKVLARDKDNAIKIHVLESATAS